MKRFTLKMRKRAQRPIVFLAEFFQLDAMLDTGAVLPVWVEDEELLKAMGGVPIIKTAVKPPLISKKKMWS